MTIDNAGKISYEIMLWCGIVFGKSKYQDDYPMIIVKYELDKKYSYYGEYDPYYNTIFIYTKLNQTTLQLTNTVIHEYIHYLQSPIWLSRYINKYGRKVKKNPYEIAASFIAANFYKICERELRSKIKRWTKKKQVKK